MTPRCKSCDWSPRTWRGRVPAVWTCRRCAERSIEAERAKLRAAEEAAARAKVMPHLPPGWSLSIAPGTGPVGVDVSVRSPQGRTVRVHPGETFWREDGTPVVFTRPGRMGVLEATPLTRDALEQYERWKDHREAAAQAAEAAWEAEVKAAIRQIMDGTVPPVPPPPPEPQGFPEPRLGDGRIDRPAKDATGREICPRPGCGADLQLVKGASVGGYSDADKAEPEYYWLCRTCEKAYADREARRRAWYESPEYRAAQEARFAWAEGLTLAQRLALHLEGCPSCGTPEGRLCPNGLAWDGQAQAHVSPSTVLGAVGSRRMEAARLA